MKTLKEKFGKFEMTKEQMGRVKGGVTKLCTYSDFNGNIQGEFLAAGDDEQAALEAADVTCNTNNSCYNYSCVDPD